MNDMKQIVPILKIKHIKLIYGDHYPELGETSMITLNLSSEHEFNSIRL